MKKLIALILSLCILVIPKIGRNNRFTGKQRILSQVGSPEVQIIIGTFVHP